MGGHCLGRSRSGGQGRQLVLPGVGAFAACMALLHGRDGLIDAMTEAVKARGFRSWASAWACNCSATGAWSFGVTPGLGWIAGDVKKIEPEATP